MEEEKRRVKVYKFEFYVIDHGDSGVENYEIELDQSKYLEATNGRYLGTRVIDWHEDCPYNKIDGSEDFQKLFSEPRKDLGKEYMEVFAIEKRDTRGPPFFHWHDTVYVNEEYAKYEKSKMHEITSQLIANIKKISIEVTYKSEVEVNKTMGKIHGREVNICWKDAQDATKEKALSKLSEEEKKSLGIYS